MDTNPGARPDCPEWRTEHRSGRWQARECHINQRPDRPTLPRELRRALGRTPALRARRCPQPARRPVRAESLGVRHVERVQPLSHRQHGVRERNRRRRADDGRDVGCCSAGWLQRPTRPVSTPSRNGPLTALLATRYSMLDARGRTGWMRRVHGSERRVAGGSPRQVCQPRRRGLRRGGPSGSGAPGRVLRGLRPLARLRPFARRRPLAGTRPRCLPGVGASMAGGCVAARRVRVASRWCLGCRARLRRIGFRPGDGRWDRGRRGSGGSRRCRRGSPVPAAVNEHLAGGRVRPARDRPAAPHFRVVDRFSRHHRHAHPCAVVVPPGPLGDDRNRERRGGEDSGRETRAPERGAPARSAGPEDGEQPAAQPRQRCERKPHPERATLGPRGITERAAAGAHAQVAAQDGTPQRGPASCRDLLSKLRT